jgi:Cys-tRNA(Pro)/Cys-tRNA(Cys) deacylase
VSLLDEYLDSERIWHKFIDKPKETIHTNEASALLGIELGRLTKNLVSVTNGGEYVLLIVPGNRKVSLRKASNALGVSNVSLLPFDEAERISGYPPGATPSLAHKTKMRIVVDESLLKYETVYCGGGTRAKALELRTKDIVSLNKAIVQDISREA